jgi:hypothetical protein
VWKVKLERGGIPVLGRTLSVEVVGQADVLARLDGGFSSDHYENEIDWRSDDGNGEMVEIPVRNDDFDERFLDGLAELVQGIQHASPVGSDFSSAAPSVWGFGMGDEVIEPGGNRAMEEADGEADRKIGDVGWFPFREKSVSCCLPCRCIGQVERGLVTMLTPHCCSSTWLGCCSWATCIT